MDMRGREAAERGRKNQRYNTFLTFTLTSQQYGIAVRKVREIIGMMSVRPVPGLPDYLKGVINLRGRVVPVLDLRSKFGLPPAAYDARTCIIVSELERADGVACMGVIVDSVREVAKIAESEIEPTPNFGIRLPTDFVLGVAKSAAGVNILLDIDRVITDDKRSLFELAA